MVVRNLKHGNLSIITKQDGCQRPWAFRGGEREGFFLLLNSYIDIIDLSLSDCLDMCIIFFRLHTKIPSMYEFTPLKFAS